MEEVLRSNLMRLAELFESVTGTSRASIGKRALNDNRIFARLSATDMGFNVRTYDRMVAWFSAHWPSEFEWPADIERPQARDEPVQAAE